MLSRMALSRLPTVLCDGLRNSGFRVIKVSSLGRGSGCPLISLTPRASGWGSRAL